MNAPLPQPDAASGLALDSRFTVPGIKCAGCIGTIERGLAKIDGVSAVRVNFSAKRVAVSHSPDLCDEEIIEELHKLGYQADRAAENPLARDDAETRRLIRALAVSGFGMMGIMLLSAGIWSGSVGITREMFHWISALIAVPVVAYAGRPFFASAAMALRYGRTNMDVPISIGVLLATGLSLYETVTGGAHAYFDEAIMLLFFLLAGRVLDAVMRDRARSGISALLGRMGKGAQVLESDGTTRWREAESLAPGMLMIVAAGESLAADGEIVEGSTTIDASMLTGESEPRPAAPGEAIHAGMINLDNPLRVRVTAAAANTVLADIARLMDEAGQSRSRYVRIADKAARLYTPVVHALALLSFAGWMFAGAGWHQSLLIAVAVLIITCPCALGLAVPAAQVAAASALMKRGLLIKDGSALERLAEAAYAMFDKTGTLTLGQPRPVDADKLPPDHKAVALALARASSHPFSRALGALLAREGVEPAAVSDISEAAGVGMRGRSGGQVVALLRPEQAGGSLGVDLVIGAERSRIAFADRFRPDVRETLAELSALGVASAIVSGDRSAIVEEAGREFAIPAMGGVEPAGKLAELDRLAGEGRHVLMVGDGLNDGPALAGAHVSIAPGGASDVSQQAADAVFLGDGLMPVALAVRVGRRTMAVVRQNFMFALIYNVLAVPLAILGYVTPMVAAIAMSASSLLVVGNSLRLSGIAK